VFLSKDLFLMSRYLRIITCIFYLQKSYIETLKDQVIGAFSKSSHEFHLPEPGFILDHINEPMLLYICRSTNI